MGDVVAVMNARTGAVSESDDIVIALSSRRLAQA